MDDLNSQTPPPPIPSNLHPPNCFFYLFLIRVKGLSQSIVPIYFCTTCGVTEKLKYWKSRRKLWLSFRWEKKGNKWIWEWKCEHSYGIKELVGASAGRAELCGWGVQFYVVFSYWVLSTERSRESPGSLLMFSFLPHAPTKAAALIHLGRKWKALSDE